jgi:hypothetical protein
LSQSVHRSPFVPSYYTKIWQQARKECKAFKGHRENRAFKVRQVFKVHRAFRDRKAIREFKDRLEFKVFVDRKVDPQVPLEPV